MKDYYKDHHEVRLLALHRLREDGYFPTFRSIFKLVEKRAVATRAGIKYQRFRSLIAKHPEKFTILEVERLAKTLKLPYHDLIEMIEEQIKQDKRLTDD